MSFRERSPGTQVPLKNDPRSIYQLLYITDWSTCRTGTQVEILGAGNAVRILLPDIPSIKPKALGFAPQRFFDFPGVVSLRVFSIVGVHVICYHTNGLGQEFLVCERTLPAFAAFPSRRIGRSMNKFSMKEPLRLRVDGHEAAPWHSSKVHVRWGPVAFL